MEIKRKHMKNIYMIMILVTVLLVVSGCGGQQETAEMNIIGFGDLQTDGMVTWGAGADVCEEENASDKEDVSEEESTSDKEDVSSEGSVSDTDAEEPAEAEDSEAEEEKEGILLCIDRSVLDNPLYDSFINNDVTATDNIPVKDGTIHDRLGFEWSGSEYYLKDLYQRFQDKTMPTGGINGIQVFGRDLDGDGKDELIVLIEYYVYSKLCGIMYPFHEENGVLYAWEEMRAFDGKGMSTFYEDGTILTAEEGANTYIHYTKKGEIEPLLYYYETPYTGTAGNWDDIECTNKLYVYENGEKSIEIIYEYEYWVHADLERIDPEMSALRGQCNTILREFTAELGEGDSVAAMSNYHRADEFAARATLEDIMSIPVDYFQAERSVYTVSYSIDEEVKENELFMQFIDGEISAYEKVEETVVSNEGTEDESSDAEDEIADVQVNIYEKVVTVADVYNEYRTSYPVYYVDAFWYAIDEVRYTMQDLDADGRAELLMLVSYGDHVEDLHVFHVENGKLYRWETMEDIRRSGNATELYFYENGMIGFVGKEDATYMQYNEDGDIELTLVIDTGRRPNGEFEFNRIYFIAYKVIVYENGVQKKVLYYEDKFATSDDEFMSTSDVFIKDEYKKIVDAFLEELGEGETIKSSNIGFYTETLFIPELVGCYRLEYLNQEELLELFEQGEIPAQRLKIENGVKQIYGEPFYITDMYPGYPYPETARADLDGDQNAELIVKGYYGGTYFDAGYGMVYSIADGEGTAQVLSYAYYNDEVWLVKSDTTHGGRVCYWFYRVDHTGAVVEEFTLHKFFWETPSEPDGPDTVYEYNDEEITKEEYDSILKSIEFHHTSLWY